MGAKALASTKADDLHHDEKGEHEPSILAMTVAGHIRLSLASKYEADQVRRSIQLREKRLGGVQDDTARERGSSCTRRRH